MTKVIREEQVDSLDPEFAYYGFTEEAIEAAAKEKGCTVEWSDDFTLMIDLDSEEAYRTYREMVSLLGDLFEQTGSEVFYLEPGENVRPSKSGNRHVTLKLRYAADPLTRILLQALLGSDLKRELLSLSRLMAGCRNPIVLFRPQS